MTEARVGKGGELFNNYGARPNEELLFSHGFALVNNPLDTVDLVLSSRGPGAGDRAEIVPRSRCAEIVPRLCRDSAEIVPPAVWRDV